MNGTLPYSIGVKVLNSDGDEYCSNLLLKGAILPAYVRKNYCCAVNGQKSITLELFRNDSEENKAELPACTPLASVEIPLPADVATSDDIEMIFTAGLNGLLIVTCKCRGKTVEKTVDL